MIYINKHNITDIYSGNTEIVEVYKGLRLVWRKVNEIIDNLSCYANGYWIDQYPWTDNTPWKD